MKNYITTFEDSKVTIIKDKDNAETAWYDITDIVKGLAGNRKSVLEYVTKVEMDIYRFFPNKDYGNNKLSVIRDEFESRIKAEEYSRFKCFGADGVIAAYNDAGSIRLTFKNGSVLVSSNSEWGGIMLLQELNLKSLPEDAHNDLFMEEP